MKFKARIEHSKGGPVAFVTVIAPSRQIPIDKINFQIRRSVDTFPFLSAHGWDAHPQLVAPVATAFQEPNSAEFQFDDGVSSLLKPGMQIGVRLHSEGLADIGEGTCIVAPTDEASRALPHGQARDGTKLPRQLGVTNRKKKHAIALVMTLASIFFSYQIYKHFMMGGDHYRDVTLSDIRCTRQYLKNILGLDSQIQAEELMNFADACHDIQESDLRFTAVEQAASRGNGDALYQMARWYEDDEAPLPARPDIAASYYARAERSGLGKAAEALKNLCARLTGEQALVTQAAIDEYCA